MASPLWRGSATHPAEGALSKHDALAVCVAADLDLGRVQLTRHEWAAGRQRSTDGAGDISAAEVPGAGDPGVAGGPPAAGGRVVIPTVFGCVVCEQPAEAQQEERRASMAERGLWQQRRTTLRNTPFVRFHAHSDDVHLHVLRLWPQSTRTLQLACEWARFSLVGAVQRREHVPAAGHGTAVLTAPPDHHRLHNTRVLDIPAPRLHPTVRERL